VSVIDGATNTASSVSAGTTPVRAALNLRTGKVYVSNLGSNDVTAIAPSATQSVPLTASVSGVSDAQTISGLSLFATSNRNPSFTSAVTSSYLPTAPAPTALHYQLDTAQGTWQQATGASGVGANPASYDSL